MRKVLSCCLPLMALNFTAEEASAEETKKRRISVSAPFYVSHFKNRPGPLEWTDGFAKNPGIFADYTREVWTISPNWGFRAGATLGLFKNSRARTSAFGGGVLEFEHRAAKSVTIQAGSYFGQVTGYNDGLKSAMSPYLGLGVGISKDLEIGTRLHVLPGGDEALINTIGLNFRFR